MCKSSEVKNGLIQICKRATLSRRGSRKKHCGIQTAYARIFGLYRRTYGGYDLHFQTYVTPKYPEIQEALEGIAITEMLHHKLLGETIYKLGGYPVMGARTYWNGSFANYTLSPQKYLRENVLAEQNAIMNYERTILNLSSDSVKMLLERIILDEEVHIKIFKQLLKDHFDVECESRQ